MNETAASGGGCGCGTGGGGGEGGVANFQQDFFSPAAAHTADEGSAESAADPEAADADAEADVSPAVTIHRVDSLTLALEAIQSRQAAACLLSPGAGGISKVAHDMELLLLDNANSRNQSGCGGSGGSGSGGEEDAPRPPNKRASSLKMAGRDLSCPEAKKVVRFADAMGLDLSHVRHVFDMDSPPEIPPQATRDLILPPSDDEEGDEEDRDKGRNDSGGKPELSAEMQPQRLYLSPSFAQPGSAPNFNSRVTAQKVVLETAFYHSTGTEATAGNVRGLIRVANLGFEKSVRVRASFDGWQTSLEVPADFQTGNCEGCAGSDQFAFTVSLPNDLKVGNRVALCVAYSVNGQTYWDNNFGDNYSFHCVAIASSQRGSDHGWTRYV